MDQDVGFFPALAEDDDEQDDSEASQKLKVAKLCIAVLYFLRSDAYTENLNLQKVVPFATWTVTSILRTIGKDFCYSHCVFLVAFSL